MHTITGQRQLLGEAERLDVQVERFLVGLGEELDPAGVAHATCCREWSFQMLIGAPIARLPIVITIGKPEARRRCTRLPP